MDQDQSLCGIWCWCLNAINELCKDDLSSNQYLCEVSSWWITVLPLPTKSSKSASNFKRDIGFVRHFYESGLISFFPLLLLSWLFKWQYIKRRSDTSQSSIKKSVCLLPCASTKGSICRICQQELLQDALGILGRSAGRAYKPGIDIVTLRGAQPTDPTACSAENVMLIGRVSRLKGWCEEGV